MQQKLCISGLESAVKLIHSCVTVYALSALRTLNHTNAKYIWGSVYLFFVKLDHHSG